MKTLVWTRLFGRLLLTAAVVIPLLSPAHAQTIRRHGFSATSGSVSGGGITARTTVGEPISGVSGSSDIVSGAGAVYWTETPVLLTSPAVLLSAITAPTDPVLLGTLVTTSAQLLVAPVEEVALLWSWGDGTTTASERDVATGTVTGTHTYATPGLYRVTLEATAGDVSDVATFEFVVVYDPEGGFVTGGGWIDSPAGAYEQDPALAGRVTLSFTARYHHDQSMPDGNAQLQLHAAGLSFQSTSLEWLVVAGNRAQLKGRGQLGGAGDFGFLMTAIESSVQGRQVAHRFRIKIWDRASGDAIIYDNETGGADDADVSTALGGGSITIHSGQRGGPHLEASMEDVDVPLAYTLEAAYPNPVTSTATLRFGLPESTSVEISVYDMLGRRVARLLDDVLEAGWHSARFDGTAFASGVYVVRLATDTGFQQTRRLTLVR